MKKEPEKRDVPADEMTMRDVFAMLAMQGYCSNPNEDVIDSYVDVAIAAYKQADAMLKERSI